MKRQLRPIQLDTASFFREATWLWPSVPRRIDAVGVHLESHATNFPDTCKRLDPVSAEGDTDGSSSGLSASIAGVRSSDFQWFAGVCGWRRRH